VQQKQHNKFINIEHWTNAILIFTIIYCSAHPPTYHDMLKYSHTIRLGVKLSNGWKNYDEQFRLRKWQDPISSLVLIDQELWLLYLLSNPSNSNVSSLGSGYKCFPFNYQGNCRTQFCSYSHNCLRCNGQHSLLNCPRQNINPNRFGGYHRGFNKVSLCLDSGQEYQLVVLSSLQPKTFSKCTAL
jgi:hypothetical protein